MNELVNSLINDTQPVSWLTKWIIQFNDFDLTSLCNNSTWFVIKTWNELSLDNIIIEDFVSQVIDWGTVIDKRYWNKSVWFTLFIQWSNYWDLISKIQELKQNLNEKNWKLYITRNWVVYSYTATCNNIVIPNFNTNEDFVDDVRLNFIITSPHWEIDEPEVAQISKIADFEKIITNIWNYVSYPRIVLIWKSGCNIADLNIELKKVWDASWEALFIDENVVDWDVVIIDYKEKFVTVNWVEVSFSWFMIPLEVWMNVFDFTFTWTINFDVIILYNKVFL